MSTKPQQGRVRVGPAGWSYADWKGIVYPEPTPRGWHALPLLSRWFDTVEINSTFYRPPVAKFCASWIRKVEDNPNFRFTAKLWQRFTHAEGWPNDDEVGAVIEGFAPLADAGLLGAVLVQFPWSFRRTPENRQHLARIVETFSMFPLAVELRHDSWDIPEVYEGLATRHVALCNIDQPIFDHSIEPAEHVTAPIGYVRLHGRNHANWFREDAHRDERYDYLYSDEELAPWLRRVESIRERAADTYVITNNHFRGQAVVNALEIEFGLGRSGFELPEHLLTAYPRLRELTKSVKP